LKATTWQIKLYQRAAFSGEMGPGTIATLGERIPGFSSFTLKVPMRGRAQD
jgi:hypothetical protein